MKKIFITAIILTAVLSAKAQGVGDLLLLSQYDYSMGTARSAAMGGAFTSLGADLSSMSINPAGLGMYRSSDVGITTTLAFNKMDNRYAGLSGSDDRTRFSLGNLGVALNMYNGTGDLTSVTFGFGYNKLADFNTTQRFNGSTSLNSITEVFAEQLNGVSQGTLNAGGLTPFQNVSTSQWGGVLAWQTGILDPATDGSGQTIPNAYTPFFNLDPSAAVNNAMKTKTKGYVAEYDISFGMNYSNKLYVGFTFGIQDINYERKNYYDEYYSQYSDSYRLMSMMYDRNLKMNGSGINLKLGLIYRPVEFLRIGLAYHSPTWYDLESEYKEYMAAEYVNTSSQGFLDSPYLVNDFRINSPSRLLTGVSFTIPNIGIISADYEMVWYSGMKLRNMGDYYDDQVTNLAKDMFDKANNFRLGAELTPTQNLFVRAGYAHYGNGFTHDDAISPNGYPDRTEWNNLSFGVGYRFGSSYLDFTYIHSAIDYNQTDIFYAAPQGANVISSGTFSTEQTRNMFSITLGSRF